ALPPNFISDCQLAGHTIRHVAKCHNSDDRCVCGAVALGLARLPTGERVVRSHHRRRREERLDHEVFRVGFSPTVSAERTETEGTRPCAPSFRSFALQGMVRLRGASSKPASRIFLLRDVANSVRRDSAGVWAAFAAFRVTSCCFQAGIFSAPWRTGLSILGNGHDRAGVGSPALERGTSRSVAIGFGVPRFGDGSRTDIMLKHLHAEASAYGLAAR